MVIFSTCSSADLCDVRSNDLLFSIDGHSLVTDDGSLTSQTIWRSNSGLEELLRVMDRLYLKGRSVQLVVMRPLKKSAQEETGIFT
ncbi:unnamed protein product [Protopolystoma xenopodis]|uniref:PDZ domain-containing protein n=1 Tax=Protopolystoma xenopodis TaxID=117903 RepID=A0A448XIR0_9PLAT|nr:unnamed protein product [Protopolystoma xenopodis]